MKHPFVLGKTTHGNSENCFLRLSRLQPQNVQKMPIVEMLLFTMTAALTTVYKVMMSTSGQIYSFCLLINKQPSRY